MSQTRKIIYRIFSWLPFPALRPSDEEIDVVIPIISKDLAVLPLCIEGVRRCVLHNIKDIYIVAPDVQEIRTFCNDKNLKFVDERSVFGYSPMELGLITTCGDNRSGWLFQQFVKLSGTIGTCRYFLCIDADHILIRPHVFLTDKHQTVFYMSYEKHQPYYVLLKRILPDISLSSLSYVDHKMLFDKQLLAKLHKAISENNGGRSWQNVILDFIDRSEVSGFSEFETYGNFVMNKILRPWKQKRLQYNKITDYETLRKKFSSHRWSLTFPEYWAAPNLLN